MTRRAPRRVLWSSAWALVLLAGCDAGTTPAAVAPAGGGADVVTQDTGPQGASSDTGAVDGTLGDASPVGDIAAADTGASDAAGVDATDAPPGLDVPPPPECTAANADYKCNDNLPCTIDACVDGTCEHTEKAACCLADTECDDGVACTIDECSPAHDCLHTFADSFCCLDATDCADQDDCTEDLCAANQCVHPRASKDCPCLTAADCDDGNPCSADACAGGSCKYGAAEGPGCCASAGDCAAPGGCAAATCVAFTCGTEATDTQTVWSASFDDASISDFTVESDASGAWWQFGTTQAVSLPGALYYGRVPEYDYDVGKTAGTAVSPPIGPSEVAGTHTLSFWIAPNVEALFSVDKAWVELRPEGGAPVVLWSKDQVTEGTITGWKHVEADVTAWAGAPFRVAFLFDSIDEKGNDNEGVWVDDVELRVPCTAP